MRQCFPRRLVLRGADLLRFQRLYLDMAIACARLLGYELTPNFDFPSFPQHHGILAALAHLSQHLAARLLYIRSAAIAVRLFTWRNLMLTMLLGGLWHGATWTFVIWGDLHGTDWSSTANGAGSRRGSATSFIESCPASPFRSPFTGSSSPGSSSAAGGSLRRNHPRPARHELLRRRRRAPDNLSFQGGPRPFARPGLWLLIFAALAALHYANSRAWFAQWWRLLCLAGFSPRFSASAGPWRCSSSRRSWRSRLSIFSSEGLHFPRFRWFACRYPVLIITCRTFSITPPRRFNDQLDVSEISRVGTLLQAGVEDERPRSSSSRRRHTERTGRAQRVWWRILMRWSGYTIRLSRL